MRLEEYNGFCASLPSATHVVQWGGADVWKVGGKVFAIGGSGDAAGVRVSFKCSEAAYDMLEGEAGLVPAPYLASRGLKWIQRRTPETMDDATLEDYLRESHRLAFLNLPRRMQFDLWPDYRLR